MDEVVESAAARAGIPAELIERAAAARAAAKGVSKEALLQEWAGGEAAPASSAPAAEPAAAETTAAAAEPAEPSGPSVEVLEPVAAESSGNEPVEVEPAEPEPRRVPTGTGALAGFPGWLAAAFLIVPILALLYAAIAPEGPNCGVSGQLAVSPVTGEAQNCDGTEYGVEVINYFSLGQEIYTSRCEACHGANGGGGAGPALAGGSVLATFPSGQCAGDLGHRQWITLGSAGWPEPTYGALAKPVGGFGAPMPAFEGTLSEEEIGAVTLFERVNFGGEPLPDALTDCELGEDAEITAEGG